MTVTHKIGLPVPLAHWRGKGTTFCRREETIIKFVNKTIIFIHLRLNFIFLESRRDTIIRIKGPDVRRRPDEVTSEASSDFFYPSIYWLGLGKLFVDNAPAVGILRCSKNPVDAKFKQFRQRANFDCLASALE